MNIRSTAIMLLACTAVVAGCAQRQSQHQYQRELTIAERRVVRAQRELDGKDIADAAWFDRQRQIIRSVADRMDAIEPPRDARQAHEVYVRGVAGLAQVLAQLTDCAHEEQATAGSGASCRAGLNGAALDRVDNDLDEARAIFANDGYRVQAV